MDNFIKITRLDKPIGIILLLFPTLFALLFSTLGKPPFYITVIFILGAILMRSAGCVINDIADRKIDLYVKRTKDRPLTNGDMSLLSAIVILVSLLFIALLLLLTLNLSTLIVATISIILVFIYPFTKRFFEIPQLVLSIAFSMPIIMVYTALELSIFNTTLWLLFLGNVLWTIAYDTQYALTDLEDDIRLNINSSAILFGKEVKLAIVIFQLAFLLIFLLIGLINNLNYYYYLSIALVFMLFIYQYYLISIKNTNGLKAFYNNSYIGYILIIGILMGLIN